MLFVGVRFLGHDAISHFHNQVNVRIGKARIENGGWEMEDNQGGDEFHSKDGQTGADGPYGIRISTPNAQNVKEHTGECVGHDETHVSGNAFKGRQFFFRVGHTVIGQVAQTGNRSHGDEAQYGHSHADHVDNNCRSCGFAGIGGGTEKTFLVCILWWQELLSTKKTWHTYAWHHSNLHSLHDLPIKKTSWWKQRRQKWRKVSRSRGKAQLSFTTTRASSRTNPPQKGSWTYTCVLASCHHLGLRRRHPQARIAHLLFAWRDPWCYWWLLR